MKTGNCSMLCLKVNEKMPVLYYNQLKALLQSDKEILLSLYFYGILELTI